MDRRKLTRAAERLALREGLADIVPEAFNSRLTDQERRLADELEEDFHEAFLARHEHDALASCETTSMESVDRALTRQANRASRRKPRELGFTVTAMLWTPFRLRSLRLAS